MAAAFFAVDFFAVVFFAVVFFAGAFFAGVFFSAPFFVPAAFFAPRAALAAARFSRPGQSMLGQSFQGPRAVSTTTIGAPQSGHSSPVAESLPRAGSG